MATKNQKGQILIELALVSFFILLVCAGALFELGKIKNRNQRFQFSQDRQNGKMAPTQIRK